MTRDRAGTCVVGASVHCGWAELVAVGARDGEPVLLDRWRAALTAPGVADAPYHHEAPTLPLAEAEALVDRVRRSVAALATDALRDAQERLGASTVVLESSPYDALPDTLAAILASRALTCAADGMMYRELVADRARALGMEVVRLPRKADVVALTAGQIGCDPERLAAVVAALGASVGPPWRKEHRAAAAAAIGVLVGRGEVSPGQGLAELYAEVDRLP